MRKLCLLLALLLSLGCLCLPVMAASQASLIQTNATVSSDGSCQLSVTVRLHLDADPGQLTFPLPSDATDIRLNGQSVKTRTEADQLLVVLPGTVAGDYTFHLSYRLPMVVFSQEEDFFLELPLLSGFAYPIATLELTVTLPGEITHRPTYSSGYHQEAIESQIISTQEGNSISAVTTSGLKDHETLSLRLETEPSLFPGIDLSEPLLNGWDAALLVCLFLSVAYYLLCLLPVVPRRVRCFTAPDGISAGEVGTCLTGCGADLTMMVLSWAQLGYIRIHIDKSRHVTLRRQMDMGNERSEFEMKVFASLFRNRPTVNGASMHYARLCRKVAGKSPLLRQLFLPSSGNPRIFRILAVLAGALSGICMALSIPGGTALHTLLGIVLCLFCGAFSYFIQSGGRSIPLGDKTPFYLALSCGAVWIALGILLGQALAAIPMVLFQFLAGIAAAYGGRRSERGKRCLAELRSLRKFMARAPASELQRMLQGNPNYFYELAPYALAMGVDRQFARRFGKEPLPDCSFLVTEPQRELNAAELMDLLRRTADTLNALQKRLPYERFRGK